MREAASNRHQDDFVFEHYCSLLDLAKATYRFVRYPESLSAADRWVLWRHDVDLSLNRAVRLAEAEASKGVVATYFLNPHCEFYNILETGQFRTIKAILAFGHDVGLHFDAQFHGVESDAALDRLVSVEAAWLGELLGCEVSAFSFHNPTDALLACDKEEYGGLINCYSRRFRQHVGYCSDSNGYWRHGRLHDELAAGRHHTLQVLTHPGLWQEQSMPSRSRVFRCVYGRAGHVLRSYDSTLANGGRENVSGAIGACGFLKTLDPSRYEVIDFLWNSGSLDTLFVELCRLHERQIAQLCRAKLHGEWGVPAADVDAFLEDRVRTRDSGEVFEAIFGTSSGAASGESAEARRGRVALRTQVVEGRIPIPPDRLEAACVSLCGAIEQMAKWGAGQRMQYDGLADLTIVTSTATPHPTTEWEHLLERIGNQR